MQWIWDRSKIRRKINDFHVISSGKVKGIHDDTVPYVNYTQILIYIFLCDILFLWCARK